jgi:hypothetical protein
MKDAKEIATKVVMSKADPDFVRVLEDLIEILCRKRVIELRDFPKAAQQKIRERRLMRQH